MGPRRCIDWTFASVSRGLAMSDAAENCMLLSLDTPVSVEFSDRTNDQTEMVIARERSTDSVAPGVASKAGLELLMLLERAVA